MSTIAKNAKKTRQEKVSRYAKNFTRTALAEFVVEHEEQIEELKARINDLRGDLESVNRIVDDCSAFLED